MSLILAPYYSSYLSLPLWLQEKQIRSYFFHIHKISMVPVTWQSTPIFSPRFNNVFTIFLHLKPTISSADSHCTLQIWFSLLKTSCAYLNTHLHCDPCLWCPFFLPSLPLFLTLLYSIIYKTPFTYMGYSLRSVPSSVLHTFCTYSMCDFLSLPLQQLTLTICSYVLLSYKFTFIHFFC